MNRKVVFVSWSGETGKHVAELLKETFFKDHPQLEAWVSSVDIGSGQPFRTILNDVLSGVEYSIGIMTPGASKKPWVNFEAGYLFGRLQNFKVILFNETVSGPLQDLQWVNGKKHEGIIKLFQDMLLPFFDEEHTRVLQARDWVNGRAKEKGWDRKLQQLLRDDEMSNIREAVGSIEEAVGKLYSNQHIQINTCFRHVVEQSLQKTAIQIAELGSSFKVPAAHYADYLVSLQGQLKAHVQALAIIDHQEHFWHQPIGQKIWETAQKSSKRVFVFTTPEQFNQEYKLLLHHAQRYEVWAMSNESFAKLPVYSKDFSIIEAAGTRLLAEYVGDVPLKFMRFSVDREEVARRQDMLDTIVKSAIQIEKGLEQDDLRGQVFPQPMYVVQKPTEMSNYIDVFDYDEHEEEHAYYTQMMERMLAIFTEHRQQIGKTSKIVRVLELGAGTGIFTERLAKLPDVQVEALELDWPCYRLLTHKVSQYQNVKTIPLDSRTDLPGKFDYIFSSFADHHIRPADKSGYFRNIRINLMQDSLFIIGDEFLRSHDLTNKVERDAALRDYHNHIIDLAEKQGYSELVKLEHAALESGLEGHGDFKLSCEQYEQYLVQSGLGFEHPEKIGPMNLNNCGGIYVYKVHLPVV